MTDRARLTIAAVVTALFLAAISAAGLFAHGHPQAPTATVPATAQPTSVQPAPAPTQYEEHD